MRRNRGNSEWWGSQTYANRAHALVQRALGVFVIQATRPCYHTIIVSLKIDCSSSGAEGPSSCGSDNGMKNPTIATRPEPLVKLWTSSFPILARNGILDEALC